MTTVAIDKDLTIAADGMASGWWTVNENQFKVFKIENDYFCFAGKIWKWQRFLDWYKQEEELLPDMEDISVLRLCSSGKLYKYEGDGVCKPYPSEVMVPFAIGSGSKYAMGAMMHGASAREAVIAASKLDVYTNDNIKEYSL